MNQAQLTITAKDQSKTVGTALTFNGTEFSTAGLVNGDSVTSATLASLGAPASATAAGSPYLIQASNASGSGLGNYAIQYLPGQFTVAQIPPTVPPLILVDPTSQAQLSALTLAIDLHTAVSTVVKLDGATDSSAPDYLPRPALLNGNPTLPLIGQTQAGEVLPYAILANDVNGPPNTEHLQNTNFHYVYASSGEPLDEYIEKMPIMADYVNSGFVARVYQDDNGQVVIAFRQSSVGPLDISDPRWV